MHNVYHGNVLMQMQRHVARTGTVSPGFEHVGATLQETWSGAQGDRPSLLEVKDEDIYVKALNAPLEHIPTNRHFQLDETPINLDAPFLR